MYPNFVIIGKAGSGKSTVADILVSRLGYERLSFAAPLKAGCGTLTDRELLQKVGHGVRELFPDFWVNLLRNELARQRAERRTSDVLNFVVDDCRYPNELEMLRGEGFEAIWVLAPRTTRVTRLRANGKLQDEAQLDDISETSLDPAVDALKRDYHIWNEGLDKHQLALQVKHLVDLGRS